MSVRGPLVAECEGVSPEELAAFVEAFQASASMTRVSARWSEAGGAYHRSRDARLFACCMSATWWAPASMRIGGGCKPPPCPVCDPVGARKSDAKALDALARDIIAAGPERVAVLLDVHQDGQPLGRLQHPDDKAEIERLRAEVDRLSRLESGDSPRATIDAVRWSGGRFGGGPLGRR